MAKDEHYGSAQAPLLKVDFSSASTAVVTEADDPRPKPVYIVDIDAHKRKLVFNSADGSSFGTSTLNTLRVNADFEIRGQHFSFRALKRFYADYTYYSRAFSTVDTPVLMTWTCTSHLTTREWVCLDPQKRPVAKFSANIWNVKEIGQIEFMDSMSVGNAAREEIVVTALTLYSCAALRSTSLYGYCAAIFFQPAHNTDVAKVTTTEKNVA